MLKNIISEISQALSENGAQRVYSAFDTVPVDSKGKEIFVVTGVEGFESSVPIYSQYTVFVPFKAEAAVNVYAPCGYPAEKLLEYFDEHILPAFESISSLTCTMKKLIIKRDSTAERLVLRVIFSVSGIGRVERSTT